MINYITAELKILFNYLLHNKAETQTSYGCNDMY